MIKIFYFFSKNYTFIFSTIFKIQKKLKQYFIFDIKLRENLLIKKKDKKIIEFIIFINLYKKYKIVN